MIDFTGHELKKVYSTSPYSIRYLVYYITEKTKKEMKTISPEKIKATCKYRENTNRACFAEMYSMLKNFYKEHGKVPNRVLFLCNPKLEKPEMLTWLTLCKKHGLIPKYIRKEYVNKGYFNLRILNLDPSTLYMYLTVGRIVQENPSLPKVAEYFYSKGIPFIPSFAFANKMCLTNKGHSLMTQISGYQPPGQLNLKELKLDLNEAVGLKNFLERGPLKELILRKSIPKIYKDTIRPSGGLSVSGSFFKFQPTIQDLKSKHSFLKNVTPLEMDKKEILRVFE